MKIGKRLKRMLYPQNCLLCGELLDVRRDIPLCGQCRPERFRPSGPRCVLCGRPVSEEGERCFGCRMHKNVTVGRSTFLYEDAVRDSIQRFKYKGMKDYALGYARLMIYYDWEWITELGECFLVPVPIHKKRLRERGYNQAAEVARELGRLLHIPVWEGLRRGTYTEPLKQMSAKSRREAVSGVFQLESADRMPSGTAILIDDIYTSGATIEECARTLRQARPERRICFWTVSIRPEKGETIKNSGFKK